jgi:hypothetical protein
MGEKFYFIFGEQPNTKRFIDEPIGYRGVPFILQRQEDGMGLDVSLNGDENRFTLSDQRDHQLPEMVYYRDRYGFEANVKFGILFENGEELITQIDFETSTTDDFSYFEFTTITESSKQTFKRQIKTKVDMFSSLAITGESIEPLVPVNMLLQAKPSIQTSEWEQVDDYERNLSSVGSSLTTWYQVNPVINLKQSEIKDTYTFFNDTVSKKPEPFNDSDFKLFLAQSNLNNVTVSLKNFKIHFDTDVDNGGNGFVNFKIRIYKGLSWATATQYILLSVFKQENESYDYDGSFTPLNIGSVQRGESVWMFYEFEVRQSTNVVIGATPRFEVLTKIFNGGNVVVTGESSAYNSIVPSFRLIDVMNQISKSTAGLPIFAPRYNIGGEFYDTVLTNGKMLGGNITDPFYVSWEDLFASVKGEGNSGYELSLNGDIFVGTEDDFYTDVECGVFEDIQFDSLAKETDAKMALNTFKLSFSNYQSMKENTEPDSGSTIHGETILTLPNKEVEGSLEVKIPWIRDAILLDVQQRLSTVVSKDTATKDDDKIFAIDTIATENDQQFTETTELQHTYTNAYLSLKSNGSVNFLVLGIRPGTTFQILLPDGNFGSYNVSEVFNTELRLTGGGNPANDGVRLTKYIYEIKVETIPLTNRTNEGFVSVLNLISPEKYSNLRYSVERIIRKRWIKFLAGCTLWKPESDIQNTYYKNNGKCYTDYDGLQITEKENFSPDVDPIYTSNWYEGITFANVDFEEFVALCNRLRQFHGYITMKDINRRLLKIYPAKLSYQNDTRSIVMDGNEKFIKAYLTITNEDGNIVVNDETIVTVLKWDLIDRKLELFDLERQRLYQGVYYYKTSINGSVTNDLSEFIDRMNLIGEKFDSTLA